MHLTVSRITRRLIAKWLYGTVSGAAGNKQEAMDDEGDNEGIHEPYAGTSSPGRSPRGHSQERHAEWQPAGIADGLPIVPPNDVENPHRCST